MRIDRLRVQGFRSLYDLQFEPRPFTVLVGPNNAGKSNIVGALGFLAEAYWSSLPQAMQALGGLESLIHRRDHASEPQMSFDVDASIAMSDVARYFADKVDPAVAETLQRQSRTSAIHIHHSFVLQIYRKGLTYEADVTSEEVELDVTINGRRREVAQFKLRGSTPRLTISPTDDIDPAIWRTLLWREPSDAEAIEEVARELLGAAIDPADILAPKVRLLSPIFDLYFARMTDIRVYRLIPSICREPGYANARGEVGIEGWNLPGLVNHLRSEHPKEWTRVIQALYEVAPGIEDVKVELDSGGHLALRFVESQFKRPWTVAEISDGTLRSLGLFSALYDPHRSVRVFEEPENSVHPWAVRVFVDLCRDVTSRLDKQVIVTSHSPVLIDYVRPEDLYLVWREGGQTRIGPLTERDPQAYSMWADGITTISGLLDSGWLRESVPLGAD